MIWKYLGLGNESNLEENTTIRALPASWYRSDHLFQLERRAVFSKRWLLVTHKLRFANTGDWIRFQEAGFSFFLCRDKEGNINGFHNVCRHRAFPVVTKDEGKARIFSCAYHGWSYGINGKLAKAPGYQDMEGFDKNKNGLLPVHVHIDHKGFIWVNLEASEKPEIAWSDDFEGIDLQTRFEMFNFEEYRFDHAWSQSGDFNWKALADNYNECYHCPTSHPDAVDMTELSIYSVDTKAGHVQHYATPKEGKAKEGLSIASTFYFPNACMTVSPHFFYMMRCVPTSAVHCSMEYEVYRHKDASNEQFEKIDAIFKRILAEDKWLCDNAQKNLNAGVYTGGELHPRMEKGPLYLQSKVRDLVKGHRKQEEMAGREIWPARQIVPMDDAVSREDEDFCTNLVCEQGNKAIEW